MKRLIVGGPILGEKEASFQKNGGGSETNGRTQSGGIVKTFDPLVTPLVGLSSSSTTSSRHKAERFVLLPHAGFIQVLAYRTGKIVANLVPFSEEELTSDDDQEDVRIESVCLAKYPAKPRTVRDVLDHLPDDNTKENKSAEDDEDCSDHVALVGCSDGTLREFSLLVLLPSSRKLQNKHAVTGDCGAWELAGSCFGPRRVFRISKDFTQVKLISAPACTIHAEYGLLLYALTERRATDVVEGEETENTSKKSNKTKEVPVKLLRLLLPPYYGDSILESKDIVDLTAGKGSARVTKVDKIICPEGQDKKGRTYSNLPFRLESIVRARSQDLFSPSHESFLQQNLFIVVARPTSMIVYCEQLSDVGLEKQSDSKKRFPPVSFPFTPKNPLCSMSISVNKSDVACGHLKGDIVIKSNLLALVEEYKMAMLKYEKQRGSSSNSKQGGSKKNVAVVEVDKPKHPSKVVIDARVHWHAHPVSSLCYDRTSPVSDPILYSGGNESVLVTWQLSRGINRPAHVLPRLALGGILNVLCTERVEGGEGTNDGILVYCEDNTLQLFESHNKALLWKIKGLTATTLNTSHDEIPSSITIDPKGGKSSSSSQLILDAMPDAPGLIQWYDPREQRVIGDLEIAPYNRVSRMERKDETPMPAPSVTHLAISLSGDDLLTIDRVPTENRFVGQVEDAESGFGIVTTIKFWSWNASVRFKGPDSPSKPYDLVAAMIHPHGSKNTVSSVALSSDGQYACTVSNDEKAFRLWQKVLTTADEDGAPSSTTQQTGGRRMPVWVCQYKITTPSGYSNFPTGKSAVAFSPDSSILAIGYGSKVAIWDRNEMTLLACFNHMDDSTVIDSIEFTKHDMILCKSSSGVSLQSPFGCQGPIDLGWSWTVADMPQTVRVSCAQLLTSHDLVAVSVYYEQYDVSRVAFIDMMSGETFKSQDSNLIENISGLVCSIGQSKKPKPASRWHEDNANKSENRGEKTIPLGLYVLTSQGELIAFQEDDDTLAPPLAESSVAIAGPTASNAPRLPTALGSRDEPARKRRRLGSDKTTKRTEDKKLSLAHFGSIFGEDDKAVPLPTAELPVLSGGFARAFIGRNLLRKSKN